MKFFNIVGAACLLACLPLTPFRHKQNFKVVTQLFVVSQPLSFQCFCEILTLPKGRAKFGAVLFVVYSSEIYIALKRSSI